MERSDHQETQELQGFLSVSFLTPSHPPQTTPHSLFSVPSLLLPLLPQLMLASFPQISSPIKLQARPRQFEAYRKGSSSPSSSVRKVTARGPDLVTCISLDQSFLSFGHIPFHPTTWKVGCDKCQPTSDPYGQDWVRGLFFRADHTKEIHSLKAWTHLLYGKQESGSRTPGTLPFALHHKEG